MNLIIFGSHPSWSGYLFLLMKCDSCQEKATVFYTQVTDGKLKKFVLCEACAEAKGITNPEGLLMAEELVGAAQTTEG